MKHLIFTMVVAMLAITTKAQTIITIAGGGTNYTNGCLADTAYMLFPISVATDNAENVYLTEQMFPFCVYKINPAGFMTEVAGVDTLIGYNGDGGPATDAALDGPKGICTDNADNLYIADYGNDRIRKVDISTGIINTVAGNGIYDYSGDGGLATAASTVPVDVCSDNAGNLYIAEYPINATGSRVRKVNAVTGIITTIAGGTYLGPWGDGGPATAVFLNNVAGICTDNMGNLYLTSGNYVRKVDAITGIITTIAGGGSLGNPNVVGDGGPATAAALNAPKGICTDNTGNLYIADYGNNRIRKIDAATGIITTLTGDGYPGFWGDGGPATAASINEPMDICLDNVANLYIADYDNGKIRKIFCNPVIPTISIAPSGTSVCAGTSVNFTSSITNGGTSPTYQWEVNGTTVGTGTSYSYIPSNGNAVNCILISSASCAMPDTITSASVTMTVNPLPVIYTVGGSGTYNNSANVTLSSSEASANYQVYNAANQPISSESGTGSALNFPVTATGVYIVVATNWMTGCSDTMNGSATIVINNTMGVGITNQENIEIYPNPAKDMITVTSQTLIGEIAITDMLGNSIIHNTYNNNKVNIDLSMLPSGIYLIGINKTFIRKIIKQ